MLRKVRNIKKLNEQEIKDYLLDYETSNQYRIRDSTLQIVMRVVHVMFDEYIKSEIK